MERTVHPDPADAADDNRDPSPKTRDRALAAGAAAIQRLTRVQQDFPVAGVLFRDLTPVLSDAAALSALADGLAAVADGATLVAGLESRGFLLGAVTALRLGTGVLAIRKPGKLPGAVLREEYKLEYGTAALELHPDDVPAGARVLIVDDVLATGGTAAAACRLIERAGGAVVAVVVAIELESLGGRAKLPGVQVTALCTY